MYQVVRRKGLAGTNYDTSIVEDEPEEEKNEGFFSSVVNGTAPGSIPSARSIIAYISFLVFSHSSAAFSAAKRKKLKSEKKEKPNVTRLLVKYYLGLD